MSECIQYAYRIATDAQIAGPDWIKSRDVRFDIVGKAPPDTPQDTLRVMMQNLLADRLKLALHRVLCAVGMLCGAEQIRMALRPRSMASPPISMGPRYIQRCNCSPDSHLNPIP